MLTLDLDDSDDSGFIHAVRPIMDGVLRAVSPAEAYVVKIDSWFGDKWLGFTNKELGAFGVQHRKTLRVPPFVPARVISQRFLRRATGGHVEDSSTVQLHLDQASKDNQRRLMSTICPDAAVVWWSGSTRQNRRGALMTYLPTAEGHTGWYAELKQSDVWTVAGTLLTTAHELSTYAQTSV